MAFFFLNVSFLYNIICHFSHWIIKSLLLLNCSTKSLQWGSVWLPPIHKGYPCHWHISKAVFIFPLPLVTKLVSINMVTSVHKNTTTFTKPLVWRHTVCGLRLQNITNEMKRRRGGRYCLTFRQTYMMLKRSVSVMPSRLVPTDITSRARPQNTWTGRYEARNHADATGNRKNSKPITHWEKWKDKKFSVVIRYNFVCCINSVCVCTCKQNRIRVVMPHQLCREYMSGILAALW